MAHTNPLPSHPRKQEGHNPALVSIESTFCKNPHSTDNSTPKDTSFHSTTSNGSPLYLNAGVEVESHLALSTLKQQQQQAITAGWLPSILILSLPVVSHMHVASFYVSQQLMQRLKTYHITNLLVVLDHIAKFCNPVYRFRGSLRLCPDRYRTDPIAPTTCLKTSKTIDMYSFTVNFDEFTTACIMTNAAVLPNWEKLVKSSAKLVSDSYIGLATEGVNKYSNYRFYFDLATGQSTAIDEEDDKADATVLNQNLNRRRRTISEETESKEDSKSEEEDDKIPSFITLFDTIHQTADSNFLLLPTKVCHDYDGRRSIEFTQKSLDLIHRFLDVINYNDGVYSRSTSPLLNGLCWRLISNYCNKVLL